MIGSYAPGSYVLPSKDGDYACPPAQVIEVFWVFKRTPDGKPIIDRNDMVMAYVELDPVTWERTGVDVRLMNDELWEAAISTADHPHFI